MIFEANKKHTWNLGINIFFCMRIGVQGSTYIRLKGHLFMRKKMQNTLKLLSVITCLAATVQGALAANIDEQN